MTHWWTSLPGYLSEECLLSLSSHITLENQLRESGRFWNGGTIVIYFWKHKKFVLLLLTLLQLNLLMTAVKVVWNVVCTFGSPVIFLVLSELNWGQSRQRKSVCQWQSLYMTEQRLTSFLINHRILTWKGFNRHTSFVIRNF